MGGCSEPPSPEQALPDINQWLSAAHEGQRDDALCHAYGLQQHPGFTCSELLEYAAAIAPSDRKMLEIGARDCVKDVCGTFVEVSWSSRSGTQPVAERLIAKQEGSQYKVYWYRSDLMNQDAQATTEPDQPLEGRYNELTQRFPSLYRYPPCLDTRVSSRTLRGEPQSLDEIVPEKIEELAAQCGDGFCFALVGNKFGTLCP